MGSCGTASCRQSPIRELRDLTRYRAALIGEHTRETNRLQKVLEDAGIKLASVASHVLGVSGRAMLEALTHGTRDPDVLADLARGALRRKLPALRQALAGRFRPHHAFLVGQVLAHLDYLDEMIATLSTHIEEVMAPFAEAVRRLDTIPGVNRRTAEVLIAEIGVDMGGVPDGGAPRQLGGPLSGQQRERGQAPIRQDPQGQPMVAQCAHPSRAGRRHPCDERRLGRPVSARDAASRP